MSLHQLVEYNSVVYSSYIFDSQALLDIYLLENIDEAVKHAIVSFRWQIQLWVCIIRIFFAAMNVSIGL